MKISGLFNSLLLLKNSFFSKTFAVTASVVLSHSWNYNILANLNLQSWRILLIIFALPGIIGSIWLSRMPESPKFLLIHNRKDEALDIVRWIHKKNLKKSKTFDIDGLKAEVDEDFIELKELKGL